MADDSGSNSVSIVAILAILILVGLVLYLVLRPTSDAGFELDVDIDEDVGTLVVPSYAPLVPPDLRV